MTAAATVASIFKELAPTDLEHLNSIAELQTRTDRKYLLPVDLFASVIDQFGDRLQVLQIGGLRQFDYESVYFDTPALDAYHRHAHGRRRRFKVRTRSYLDWGQTTLEIKTEGGRGETIKERHAYQLEDRKRLDEPARIQVSRKLGYLDARQLGPSLTTNYLRSTLLDRVSGSRLTCDVDLTFSDEVRRQCGPDDLVLLESKTTGSTTPIDTALWLRGHRPVSISKYCTGLALIHPGLPANRWNRTLRRYFGWRRRTRTDPAVDAVR